MILTKRARHKRKMGPNSRCSFHKTPKREVLFDLEEFEGGKILLGNNTLSEAKGIGKLKILNTDLSKVVLTEVRLLLAKGINLIFS